MGWIDKLFEKRRLRRLTARIAASRAEPLDARLEAAVAEVARAMPERALPRGLRPMHAALVMVFARQAADARMRLSSSYWSSNGRNVGQDVMLAEMRARELLIRTVARRPTPRRPLSAVLEALDPMIDAQRKDPVDQDGYGLGTLHEIRRDLAALALSEGAGRSRGRN